MSEAELAEIKARAVFAPRYRALRVVPVGVLGVTARISRTSHDESYTDHLT